MPVDRLPLVVEDANMTNTPVCKHVIKYDKITVSNVFFGVSVNKKDSKYHHYVPKDFFIFQATIKENNIRLQKI